jgi:hypothetical protein
MEKNEDKDEKKNGDNDKKPKNVKTNDPLYNDEDDGYFRKYVDDPEEGGLRL